MGKITDFLSKYKNYVIGIIILLFVIGLFVGGIFIGKGIKANQDLKQTESTLKNDIKTTEIQVKSTTKNAQILIDSAGIYEAYAIKQGIKAAQINTQINNKTNETQTNINHIDALSHDSIVILFSRYAKEYIDAENTK